MFINLKLISTKTKWNFELCLHVDLQHTWIGRGVIFLSTAAPGFSCCSQANGVQEVTSGYSGFRRISATARGEPLHLLSCSSLQLSAHPVPAQRSGWPAQAPHSRSLPSLWVLLWVRLTPRNSLSRVMSLCDWSQRLQDTSTLCIVSLATALRPPSVSVSKEETLTVIGWLEEFAPRLPAMWNPQMSLRKTEQVSQNQ